MSAYRDSIDHFRQLGGRVSYRGSPFVVGLQMENTPTADDDLRHLFTLRDEIDVVALEGTQVTDLGLQYLCDLPSLDNVDLTNTRVTDAGLEILSRIRTLRWVHLEGTH